jgi:exosortase/archaeosortase family protein
MALAFLQWAAERSAPALWLTERVVATYMFGVRTIAREPIHADGLVVKLNDMAQEVTPACLGLAAVTVYLAAVLATPAGWRERLVGAARGLAAIVAANLVRLFVLTVVFVYAFAAFGFVHIPMWGTVVPLFLVALWAFWLVRDLRYLPRFPLRFFGLVALFLVVLFGAWYVVLDQYLVALVLAVNSVLSALAGVPIESLRLTATDLFRHLDVGLPSGGFRIELAGQTLSLVPCLALILASPITFGRRLLLALCGAAILFMVQGAVTGILIVLGWSAPWLVPIFQIENDFLSLAAGPSLWLLLTRPSRAWFAGASDRTATQGSAAVPRRPRPARGATRAKLVIIGGNA